MRVAYFDCFSGISGDMILGSLIDAGFDIAELKRELKKLKLKGYRIKKKKVKRGSLRGTKFDVILDGKRARTYSPGEMIGLVDKSGLEEKVKRTAKKIFRALARAEAAVHGIGQNRVHFHELGDADTIIDVVGTAVAFRIMGIERVFSSPLVLGRGRVNCGHGVLPVPSPATLNLLKEKKVIFSSSDREMVTPTGAAVISSLAECAEEAPFMEVDAIGYGAGSFRSKTLPNLLRVVIGETDDAFLSDEVIVLETNIDDLTPLNYQPLFESLKEKGALDVYLTPVQMKKSRPGCLITVILKPHHLNRICSRIFAETTTFGLRYHRVQRKKLARKLVPIKTRYGKVRVKVGKAAGSVIKIAPEYEDCRACAREKGVSFREVYEEAVFLTRKHDYDKLQ